MRKMLALTSFARERLFDPNRGGTCISDRTADQLERELNSHYSQLFPDSKFITRLDGYAPFCKLFVFSNWTDATLGTAVITDRNRHLLQSDYQARTENELPVLSRWFEMENVPRADYLIVVGYSAEQMEVEGNPIDAEWGVVAVLGQDHAGEQPLMPITMMRNALGISEGGSGVPLDREAYLRSVVFWRFRAVVKKPSQKQGSLA